MPASPASNAAKLRRAALAAQGLTTAAPFGRGINGTNRALEHLGYVQIDTISVVQRAHHHVFATRVPNYQPNHLNRLIERGDAFEYWHHAAAFMPMIHYRFARIRMQDIKNGVRFWSKRRDLALEAKVLDRIRIDGPLMARDFEDANHNSTGWWEWKPAKHALEQLFMQGDLCIASRDGFQKRYDLPERVLPGTVITKAPSASEYAAHLLEQQLANFGCATPKSVNYFQRFPALRPAIADLFKARVASGELMKVSLPEGQIVYSTPQLLASRSPTARRHCKILSPFDNSVIQRERAINLFNFDYQIECYVPAPKRKYGYFCLPIVYGDQFVGRMDCKAHRDKGWLQIKRLYLESPELLADANDHFGAAFASACHDFAEFNGCTEVTLEHCEPRKWLPMLKRSLKDR